MPSLQAQYSCVTPLREPQSADVAVFQGPRLLDQGEAGVLGPLQEVLQLLTVRDEAHVGVYDQGPLGLAAARREVPGLREGPAPIVAEVHPLVPPHGAAPALGNLHGVVGAAGVHHEDAVAAVSQRANAPLQNARLVANHKHTDHLLENANGPAETAA